MNSDDKILFLVTEDWAFCSHRLVLAREAKRRGFDVVVATRVSRHGKQIEAEGFKLIPIRMERSGRNPLKELLTIWELVRIYKAERPQIVHHVAMKPVLYGSLAAMVTKVPHVINALIGLGYIFISNKWKAIVLRKFVTHAFRFLLNRANSLLIIQNADDKHLMLQLGVINRVRTILIRGSGADTHVFSPTQELPGIPTIVLASRMLWDKGVGEFVEAAQLLRNKGVNARFVLVGDADTENPASVLPSQLKAWNSSGVVEWWGWREDMPEIFAESHIVCLPSYREGLPKVLIEAAASARAIVTTDVPGCREIVLDGKNGFLVPARSVIALADALGKLIKDRDLRGWMGANGRELAISEFSIEKVLSQTLSVYEGLVA
ncbi:MAG: glycosyltransferase family 4 protein [Candidatus Scalindua sp.]|nr:glycosyltransferase family 4 protein [Candidatus Scalindua sp.]MBT6049875.1 glycosyltransferase family 4 protein [Candidatus Scalindua sp.]